MTEMGSSRIDGFSLSSAEVNFSWKPTVDISCVLAAS